MSYNSELQSNNTDLQSILETINNLPSAGGGSGGGQIEYEIITVPAGATSATYTLSRVTAAYGCLTATISDRFANDEYHRVAVGVWNNLLRCITYVCYDSSNYGVEIELSSDSIDFNNGTINFYGATFLEPINILLINDPNEPWAFG